jgi:hypothetical protein
MIWLRRASLWSLIAFAPLFLFFQPLCDCPWYYAEIAVLPLIAVVCGPRTYRFFGILGLILSALMVNGQIHMRDERQREYDRLQERIIKEHEQAQSKP